MPHAPSNAASAEEFSHWRAHAGFKAHVRWHGDGTDGLLDVVFSTQKSLPVWKGHSRPTIGRLRERAICRTALRPATSPPTLRRHLVRAICRTT